MKSDTKIKIILVILGINFVLTSAIYKDLTFSVGNIDINKENLKLSKVSVKIHIDNNWTEVKTAGLCMGDGKSSDPYIIEDLIIDAGGSNYGILIENSNEFFKIENVTIYSGLNGSGIKLRHSANGILINNNCSSNRHGISLWISHNNIISGNIVYNNDFNGMDIWDSNNNSILENFIYKNKQAGISFSGEGNTIMGNTLNNNYNGMVLSSSSNNTILGNSAYNNTDKGIWVYNSNNNEISGNTVSYSKYGIFLTKSKFNIFSRNTAINNSLYGMVLDFVSSNNDILENTITNNKRGLKFYVSNYNTLYLNNFDNDVLSVLYDDSVNNWNSKKKIVYTYNGKNFTNYLGNYWSDYNGPDANNDGIGDIPYIIEADRDDYPLMEPIENYIIIRIAEPSEKRILGYNIFLLLGILSVAVILINKKLRNS